MPSKIEDKLKATFRPEFLNRIDEIIIFGTLSVEDVEKIVDLQMKEIRDRLREHGLFIELTEAARQLAGDDRAMIRSSARARCAARCNAMWNRRCR